MVNKLLSSVCFILLSIATTAQNWQQSTDFPATERDDASVFVIGNKAYCGTGYKTGWVPCLDFYAFDMSSEQWTTIAGMPIGTERQYASAFAIEGMGYVVGGYDGASYFNDLWMYDPLTDVWQAKTALPDVGRAGMSCFVINDTAYLIGGKTSTASAINQVWAYAASTDSWVAKNNLPFGARWRGAATSFDNKGYLLFGLNAADAYTNRLYSYSAGTDTWTELSTFPNEGRTYAGMIEDSTNLLIVAGIDSLGNSQNDLWRYDLSAANWQQLIDMPCLPLRGGLLFKNSATIFYTTGIDKNNNRLKQTWRNTNPTGIEQLKQEISSMDIFPNPTEGKFKLTIFSSEKTNYKIRIYSSIGELLHLETTEKTIGSFSKELELLNYSKGIYFVRVEGGSIRTTVKLIVR